MSPILRSIACFTLATAFLGGCREREPSADIFEAINRKHFQEAEVRAFVSSDRSLVSSTDESGSTPLYLVAGDGRVSLIEFFIAQGADVNQPGYGGITPLGAACHSGELEAAKVLLSHGADPNLADAEGETPLHQIIMWCPDEFELFRMVVDSGGRLDVLTADGRTMLEFCRDRREDYEDPDYSGSDKLRKRLLDSYDRLETFIASESQSRSGIEQGGADQSASARELKPGGDSNRKPESEALSQ